MANNDDSVPVSYLPNRFDGNVVETYTYDVYGQCQASGAITGNPYRFTGRHWDEEITTFRSEN